MKVMNFINDIRTVATTGLLLVGCLAWAADTVYMKKTDGQRIVAQMDLHGLQREITKTEIMRDYEPDPQRKKMYNALITGYESDIKTIMRDKDL